MRILAVAPDTPGIDAIPEVRRIQSWHDCSLLYGTVTAEDIFRACQEKAFDVLHFAAHGGPNGMQLSGGALLPAEDIAQFVRLRETRGVFFSSCQTGRLAAYCVRHGAQWAVSSEVDLEDGEAWKLPAAFYSHQRNGHSRDFVGAYLLADSGDGEYALHMSPAWVQELQRSSAAVAAMPQTTMGLTRAELLRWLAAFLLLSAVLSWAIMYFGGG